MNQNLTSLLHDLGIPSHLNGYLYLKESILILSLQTKKIYITKEIYPLVALKYNTTPSRVERSIRTAIEIGSNRGNLKLIEEIFGYSISYKKTKPTNSEFIFTLVDKLDS
ncbi:MAG: sporulation initiation factor Spo0A C-terminal domain-containing protein [Bacilli bacterium]|nr:sporulation initiation factor Spo0A C-terminal domain-containing protein [Bacilli bacterium]